MKRDPLLNLLAGYRRRWTSEEEMVAQMISFVTGQPDCFERSLVIGHVTGSAWVVDRAGTHVLLTHHRKLDRWLQLGGHADGDPDILRVALREVKEESGLHAVPVSTDIFDIDIHLIPERKGELAHFHYDARFLLRVVDEADPEISDESHDVRWIPLDELNVYTHEASMLRMAAKWRECFSVKGA